MRPVYAVFFAVLLTATQAFGRLPGQAEALQTYLELSQKSPLTKDALTLEERNTLWKDTADHKIAKLSMVSHYDLKGDIGFCFGRAMTAHLLARKAGLKPEAIRKLFIIGDLRSGDVPEWRFHVTTLVKGDDGVFHAIDPLLRPPLGQSTSVTVPEWMDKIQGKWDKNKKARLYFVDAENVIPDMSRFGKTLEDETKERIIELSFDPIGKVGFTPFDLLASLTHELDATAQAQHYMRGEEATAEDSFNFLKLVMTVHIGPETKLREFDFNGYFLDLLEDLSGNAAESPAPVVERRLNVKPLGLGSIRIGE